MNDDLLGKALAATARLLVGGPNVSSRALKEAKSTAEQQFREYVASTSAGVLVLKGADAQILDVSESFNGLGGEVADYVLTIAAVTPDQRYFVFKSNALGKPFVKELTADRARLVLKGKFRPYSDADA